MAQRPKITTGPNDRPIDETIGQSGEGLPDDSSRPVEVEEKSINRVRKQWGGDSGEGTRGQRKPGNPEAVPAGSPSAGENVCRRCSGTGEVNGGTCPECGGSGKVTTPIGGG